MAIETAKDSLILNQIIDQKKDTIFVEEDCIVPDVKPDILNVISSKRNSMHLQKRNYGWQN